jgi:hypothetical protein
MLRKRTPNAIRLPIGLWLLGVVLTGGCAAWSQPPSDELPTLSAGIRGNTHIKGVIHYKEFDGGIYYIHGDDSINYEPINLPKRFRKADLTVEARAQRLANNESIHSIGPVVKLLAIQEVAEKPKRKDPDPGAASPP